MNTKGNRGAVILITALMASVVSALFFIVKVTPLFITAYIFALIGIGGFCMGDIYLLSNKKSYPWFAAFPLTIWQYIIAEIILSAVFIIRENFFDRSLPVNIFAVIHIALLAFFAIFLILIKGSKDIIENRDARVKEKVTALRFMQADVESLIRRFPNHAKVLREVADAIRYSDPMSHPSLSVLEEYIRQELSALSNLNDTDSNQIQEMCALLLQQIAERNNEAKLMK